MIRRVVTGPGTDGPRIVSDGEPPRTHVFAATPHFANALVWATAAPAAPGDDPTAAIESYVPAPGETRVVAMTLPPDSVYADPDWDPVQAGAEGLAASPGLAETFEIDNPGMHTTPTVDYAVVIDGTVVLDLGTESTVLGAGDIVVQNATRHAWRNPGDTPATLLFVLVGAVV